MTATRLLFRSLPALGLLALCLMSLSCSKKSTEAQPKTITDVVLERADFSILNAGIAYAGIGDALKATNLTLFAPNDAAFQASNLTAASLTALSKDSVRKILLYHVLFAKTLAADIPAGTNAVSTANNQATAYLIKNGANVFINNAKVVVADQLAANGVIHTIDRVLTPSRGTLLDLAQSDPTLSYLFLAASRAATTNPTLLNTLITTPITVFAPTNAAFQAAGYASTTNINQASPQALATLLSYHIVPGVLFSSQITAGPVTTLLQSTNNKLTLSVGAAGITVKGNQNATPVSLLAPPNIDIPTSNGVVHKINQLLQP